MFSNIVRKGCVSANRSTPLVSFLRNKAAYNGEGKTTVRIINQEVDTGLMIDTYATFGFRLNNGITVLGPMAIFPRAVLSWNVGCSEDITEGSFKLFKLLEPKVDLVVIGLETKERAITDRVFKAARASKLNIELLETAHACSTFNFLSSEGRFVAGALIPPTNIQADDNDMLQSKLHYDNLYKQDFE